MPRALVAWNVFVAVCLCTGTRALAETSSSPQDQADFLAGLPVSGGTAVAALQKSSGYESHRNELAAKWDYCRKARWEAMQSWARKNLGHSSTRGVVRYLFGGPDFLGAHAFFPNADVIVLGGLEPVGMVTPPETLAPAALEASLAATRQAISTALFAGYFVTREMNAQLRQGNFWGVLPLLYAQMALTGNKIVSVEMVRPFGSPGVKIGYRRGMRGTQTLYYFQANVANGAECGRFMSWLGSLGKGASYLKAASYLMHRDGFSQVRSFLLETSTLLVEDDSGIPFRHFDRGLWKIKVFGEYTQPIFSGYYQNDFRDAYTTRANAGALPFGAGYQVLSDKANILVAMRNGEVPRAPEVLPAEKPAPEARPSGVLLAEAKTEPRLADPAPAKDKTDARVRPPIIPKPKPAKRPSGSTTLYLAGVVPKPAPAPATVAAVQTSRRGLIALEAEELRIRQDAALSQDQRTRKLREIWQQQLAVMGKTST
jgi:hypothetical protein